MTSVDWSWSQRYSTFVLPQSSTTNPISPSQQYYPDQHPTPSSMASIPENQQAQPFAFTAGGGPQALHSSNSYRSLRSANGRKRSRDEFSDAMSESDFTTSPFPSVAATPAGEPILGPGMTLIYPDDPSSSRQAAAANGVWTEELIEQFRNQSVGEFNIGGKRPGMGDSRKSMRMDTEALTTEDVVPIASRMEEPVVDSATLALGVGWYELPSTSTMAAAARGWAKYIEQAFPLQGVRIIWHYRGGPAYLVSASTCEVRGQPGVSGYYLFDDNLSEGKLVAKSFERTLDNLRKAPFAFEGQQTLRAGDSTTRASAGPQADGMELD